MIANGSYWIFIEELRPHCSVDSVAPRWHRPRPSRICWWTGPPSSARPWLRSSSAVQSLRPYSLPYHMSLNGCPSNVHMMTWLFPSLDDLMNRGKLISQNHGNCRLDPKQTCQIAQGELATWDLAHQTCFPKLGPKATNTWICSRLLRHIWRQTWSLLHSTQT